MKMESYMVVTTCKSGTGLRCYHVYALTPTLALRDAIIRDYNNYPDNPSEFSAVEVFKANRSVLSI